MTRGAWYLRVAVVGLGMCLAVTPVRTAANQASGDAVRIDGDDIGGVVTSAKGPEGGVWVIAQTRALPTMFRKIVVTDEQGRYVLPDLPEATYSLWVRGYGLVDSSPVQATPGAIVNLTAVVAPNPRAAAYYYPSNRWLSLLEVPPESDFPGTGPNGNGISPAMQSQAHWIAGLTLCVSCHQLGNQATREIPTSLGTFDSTVAAWNRRVQSGVRGPVMSAALSRFGRQRILGLLADWSDRIAGGEVPPAPPRPEGVERNVVITLWDWSDQYSFNHDSVSTDKRDPTVNANGPVYNVGRFRQPNISILDPTRNEVTALSAPIRDPDTPLTNPQTMTHPSPYWGEEIIWSGRASLHNPMMDHKGRVWLTHAIRRTQPDFCKQGSSHPSAILFPLEDGNPYGGDARQLSVYDPNTQEFTLVDTCYGTHHLQFAEDSNHTLWTSTNVGGQVVGFFNTKLFDETGDAAKSQGWTAFILDTNGNGRRDAYVEPDDPIDPSKDKRIRGGSYGIISNPVDGSIWTADALGVPGAIYRISPGSNPPATTLVEVYEPPFNNPGSSVTAHQPRGIDVDRNGLIWTAFASSGHLASFDRRQCKVLNGPTATGQHCPEGWRLYQLPGPKYKGVTKPITTNMLYYNWVDQFDVFGLGKNVPIATGSGSESLVALLPETGEFLEFRVPFPMGFFHRSVDGRIDDPEAGWKGRGLWANYGSYTPWHYEGGKGTTGKAVKFQLRPNPLAK